MYRTVAGALILFLLSAFAPAAVAAAGSSDVGSAVDLAAIRHDLPIVMSAELERVKQPLIIEWVVSDGHRAMASWLAKPYRGLVSLVKQDDRWWWIAESTRRLDGWWSTLGYPVQDLGFCYGASQWPPSAKEALAAGYIDKAMYTSVRPRLRTTPLPSVITEKMNICDGATSRDLGDYTVTMFPGSSNNDIYLHFLPRNVPQKTNLYAEDGRYDFSFIAKADYPKTAPKTSRIGGATLSLWAPFVLDRRMTYTLDLAGIQPPITGLRATLKYNTLTFTLPSFMIRTAAIAHGTIRKEL